MGRGHNENTDKAYELYKTGMKLVEVASQLNIPPGTVRRWKSIYKWDGERSDKNNERSEKKCTKEKAIAKEVMQLLENSELNDKQRLFCLYYAKCFNATKAYKKAYGCDDYSAMVNGSRLLSKDKIKEQIQNLKQEKLNQAFLKPEDIFQKYMDIAFSDITDFLEFGREEVPVMGPFGPIELKDEETGAKVSLTKIVNTVKFKESSEVDGTIISEVKQGKDGASIKLQDRMKALQWLTDHMNMATEKQRAEIAILKSKANLDDSHPTEDDGFIEALSGKVDDIWQEE
ncbi:MAG: terminase small subunit [Sedimentibacter sp.]|uniref:terminase small subunit n=1 Tax=Sedimentibacter sp. TaxID=1960295 RepID=UPI00298263C8|nr:terminase small subunit [Sedimentibacter sp.]MDW5300745.1 terminase small subunit [Sedimentibacter sp.]